MKKKYNNYILILFIFTLLLFTNNFFSYEESLIYGGSDGRYYISISNYAPFFGEGIEYIKGERFLAPYLIGLISKVLNLEIYFLYQFFSVALCLILLFLLNEILNFLKLNNEIKLISLFLVLFNPYLLRYFIAVPTMLIDILFLISLELLTIGFLKDKKKFLYFGLILSLISRQNGLFVFLCFFIIKLIYKKNSLIKNKDLIAFSFIFFTIFLLNMFYAINSSPEINEIDQLYTETLFGILNINYTFSELLKYSIFPIFSFGPLIVYFLFSFFKNKKKIKLKNFSELTAYITLSGFLFVAIAFVGGPEVTGKNLLRLSNYAYLNFLIAINILFIDKNLLNFLNKKINIILVFLILSIWSFHPTFSKVNIFERFTILF